MRKAALAVTFAAIALVVLPSCGSDENPWGPLYLPGVPTEGSKTFNCTKICRDANGNITSNHTMQIQADTQADAIENRTAIGVCPNESDTQPVGSQPAQGSQLFRVSLRGMENGLITMFRRPRASHLKKLPVSIIITLLQMLR